MKIFKRICFITGLIITLWFCIPLISLILNLGNAVGILFGVLIMLYGIFMDKVNDIVRVLRLKRSNRIILDCITILAISLLFLFLFIDISIHRAAANRPKQDATLLVLGCHVRKTQPSLMLYERLQAALEYMNEHSDCVAVLSGGQGSDEDISESLCMYNYLTDNGIAPERLYMEDRSTSTIENLEFSYEIIKENGLSDTIAIVTNEFHICRASMIAKKLGLVTYAIPAHTHWWFYPTYLVREWFGVIYEFCR